MLERYQLYPLFLINLENADKPMGAALSLLKVNLKMPQRVSKLRLYDVLSWQAGGSHSLFIFTMKDMTQASPKATPRQESMKVGE